MCFMCDLVEVIDFICGGIYALHKRYNCLHFYVHEKLLRSFGRNFAIAKSVPFHYICKNGTPWERSADFESETYSEENERQALQKGFQKEPITQNTSLV